MYTTFFGGIGRYQWDAAKSMFVEHDKVGAKSDAVYLDGLQWTDQVATLMRHGSATEEIVEAMALPNYMGADAVFIPLDEIAKAAPGTEILDLNAIKGKRFVGYIYGGIRASPYQFPYTKTSRAYTSGSAPSLVSGAILKVYVVKTQ
jgi:hypothetical protein